MVCKCESALKLPFIFFAKNDRYFPFAFESNFTLKRHMKKFHKGSSVCDSEVGSVSNKEKSKFSCDKCPLIFASNFTLKRHMHKLHMGSSERITYFKNHFMSRAQLFKDKGETIVAIRSPELIKESQEDVFKNMNSIIGDLITEAISQSKNETELMCKKILLEILDVQFKPEPKIKCPKCEKGFYTYRGYKMHYMHDHNSKNRFYCNQCHYFLVLEVNYRHIKYTYMNRP